MRMKLKAHIAAIAIIMLLGLAIAGFLFMVKEKAELNAKELIKDEFSKKALGKIEYYIEKACSNEKSYLIISSPGKEKLYLNGKKLCMNNICKKILNGKNCSVKTFNMTLYKEDYEFTFNKKGSVIITEAKIWQ